MSSGALRSSSLLWAVAFALLSSEVVGLGEVTYAVNCGGEAHTDIYGIRYERHTPKNIIIRFNLLFSIF